MILKRKIYKKLLEWKKECQGKKALLIEGARRIGKSTICEEFGKNEYESCIFIDFAKKDKEIEQYFEGWNYLYSAIYDNEYIENENKQHFVLRKRLQTQVKEAYWYIVLFLFI